MKQYYAEIDAAMETHDSWSTVMIYVQFSIGLFACMSNKIRNCTTAFSRTSPHLVYLIARQKN
jgi:hypothetical protein